MIAVKYKSDKPDPKQEFSSTYTYAFLVILSVVVYISLLIFFANYAR